MLNIFLLLLVSGQTVADVPQRSRMDCGLRLTVIEDHTLPLVSVQLWYRAGSALDDPARPGLCHVARTVMEHRGQAALRLRAAGVRFEALTLPDACCFASVLPPELLEHVLAIEADRMRSRTVERSELEAALQAAARPERPDLYAEPRAIYQRLRAGAFRGHQYGHASEHVAASLADLTRREIDEFVKRRFVPSNAVLVVIGDVRTPRVRAEVQRHFGPLSWTEAPHTTDLPAVPTGSEAIPAMTTESPGLRVAWALPRLEAVERVAMDVLTQRLCNPVDGPLNEALRGSGLSSPVWRGEYWEEAGLVTLSADQRGPAWSSVAVESAVKNIRDVLTQAARRPATEIELNRARALAARRIALRRQTFADRALELGEREVVGGDALLADFERAAVGRVTVGDLQRAASELLAARMVWMPESYTASRPTSAPADLPAPLVVTRAEALDAAAALELLHQHARGVPGPQGPSAPGMLSTETLDNGVRVTVYGISGAEPTIVRTLIDAPYSVAASAATLPAVGSAKRDLEACRDYLSYHGLDLFSLSEPRSGLHSRGPASKVAQMVELQADMIRHPDLSDAARDAAYEQLHRANWLRDVWPPEPPADEYYLGAGMTGCRPDLMLRPRKREEVTAHLQGLGHVDDVEVLVVGDVRPADVTAAVRDCWRDWQPPPPRPAPATAPASLSWADAEPLTAIGWARCEWAPTVLLVNDELSPTATEPSLRHFSRQWIGWTLAGALRRSPELDAERTWRWHWFFVKDDWMGYRTFPASGNDLGTLVEPVIEQMRKLRRGGLPAAQSETALRQARVDRLLSLDGTDAIADLLQRGIREPWDLHAELEPADLARLAAEVYGVKLRTIGGEGPTNREPELLRFRTAHGRPERSPGE